MLEKQNWAQVSLDPPRGLAVVAWPPPDGAQTIPPPLQSPFI